MLAGLLVKVEGCSFLHDLPLVEKNDAVGERHGFDLIMRYVDHRGREPIVQTGDLDTHLRPEAGIEIGERLVEQKHVGFAHDGAPDGHALALASGKLSRLAVEQFAQMQNLGHLINLAPDLGLRRAHHA